LSAVIPHAASMDISAALRFCFTTARPACVMLLGSSDGDMPTAYTPLSTVGQQRAGGFAFIFYGLRAV
jgi:hypothetical protein